MAQVAWVGKIWDNRIHGFPNWLVKAMFRVLFHQLVGLTPPYPYACPSRRREAVPIVRPAGMLHHLLRLLTGRRV